MIHHISLRRKNPCRVVTILRCIAILRVTRFFQMGRFLSVLEVEISKVPNKPVRSALPSLRMGASFRRNFCNVLFLNRGKYQRDQDLSSSICKPPTTVMQFQFLGFLFRSRCRSKFHCPAWWSLDSSERSIGRSSPR